MSELDNILNIEFTDGIDSNFFRKVNHIGSQGVEFFRDGNLESAKIYKESELSYLELALNSKKNFCAELICGASYATLGNIYFKLGDDDILPLLFGYIRISQGVTYTLDKQIEKNSIFDRSVETLEYISYILLNKKEWNSSSALKGLDTFPTIVNNKISVYFYKGIISKLDKENIALYRKTLKEKKIF